MLNSHRTASKILVFYFFTSVLAKYLSRVSPGSPFYAHAVGQVNIYNYMQAEVSVLVTLAVVSPFPACLAT